MSKRKNVQKTETPSKGLEVQPKSAFRKRDIVRFVLRNEEISGIDTKLKKIYGITN